MLNGAIPFVMDALRLELIPEQTTAGEATGLRETGVATLITVGVRAELQPSNDASA